MSPLFEGNWNKLEDLREWDGALEVLAMPGVELVFASYDDEDGSSGIAWAIWRQDGKLWEAKCSHCSCDGLESFEPEETSVQAIMMRQSVPYSLWLLLKSL